MGLCHRFVDRICQSSERWSPEEALESSKQSLRGSLCGSHKNAAGIQTGRKPEPRRFHVGTGTLLGAGLEVSHA